MSAQGEGMSAKPTKKVMRAAMQCARHIVATQKREGFSDSWFGGESNLAAAYLYVIEDNHRLTRELAAARDVTDEQVERAARYDYEATVEGDVDAWSRAHPVLQRQIRERMRAILDAARTTREG